MGSYNCLGKKIKQARKNKGYSQKNFASKIGIDLNYLCKIENNRIQYPPTESVLNLVAKELDLNEKELTFLAGRVPEKYLELIKKHYKLFPIFFVICEKIQKRSKKLLRDKIELI
ncbi:MAG: helix-turn-helix transcriptional regulator [Prochloraceae cyanobacterium]|nr:helix-turn-helix transcriptional regulator [Prochloraceae cyanobacterium]